MPKIVINPIGGLANRMRAIACGISLAQRLNVPYSILWAKNWELNAEFNDIFLPNSLIDGIISYPCGLTYALFYSPPRKKNCFVTSLTLRRFGLSLIDSKPKLSELISLELITEIIGKTLNQNKDVFIQSGLEFCDFSDSLYRKLFRPNHIVMQRVKALEVSLGENRIGLHIRRSDNLQSIKHSPDYLFQSKIDEILNADPTTKFYLASDNEETKSMFRNKYPGIIFTSASPAVRNSKEGIIDAVVEMTILSRTRQIFGSFYSSYSEAAATLGGVPLQQLTKK